MKKKIKKFKSQSFAETFQTQTTKKYATIPNQIL